MTEPLLEMLAHLKMCSQVGPTAPGQIRFLGVLTSVVQGARGAVWCSHSAAQQQNQLSFYRKHELTLSSVN